MDDYRVDGRTRVAGALGVIDKAVLEKTEARESLDVAIGKWAMVNLSRQIRLTFYHAFGCCPGGWEEVQARLNELRLERSPLQLETVQRYGENALKEIAAAAPRVPEFRRWVRQYFSRERSDEELK